MTPAKDFQIKTGCSDEVLAKLEIYHALLLKWQKAINLVSPKTIDEAWLRHFYDSAQLEPLILTSVRQIADLGSGAGFAGLVLAIMRPDIDVHLVESDERKCQFMRNVSRETQVSVTIHNGRIENVLSSLSPDLVMARALASLEQLCGFMVEANLSEGLFLKGRHYEEELLLARKRYSFDLESYSSQTGAESRILYLLNLRKRN